MWLASEGLIDKVKPIQDCPPVRQYVQATVGKVSFPAIELEEGKVNELSDGTIEVFVCHCYVN